MTVYCSGTGPSCPTTSYMPATTVCYVSTGPCDGGTLNCSGTSPNCPTPVFKSSSFACIVGGACANSVYCSGTNGSCGSPVYSTSNCRPSTGPCDPDEFCTGTSSSCPSDIVLGQTSKCGNVTGDPLCFVGGGRFCTGSGGACPPQVAITSQSTVACGSGASAGVCSSAGNCIVQGPSSVTTPHASFPGYGIAILIIAIIVLAVVIFLLIWRFALKKPFSSLTKNIKLPTRKSTGDAVVVVVEEQ